MMDHENEQDYNVDVKRQMGKSILEFFNLLVERLV